MTKRTSNGSVLVLFGIVVFLSAAGLAVAEKKPNILLVMADDQGWGDTGYNGHPRLKTPHLDEMASSGLRFDRFYAAHPVCSPTRGSVLTGRHSNRFGCFTWGHTLRPQEITIAEALKTAGYATGHFGKWHVGSVRAGSPVNPSASGFDTWLSAPNYYDNDPVMSRNGKAVKVEGESSMLAAEMAINFMKNHAHRDKPFLAVVWFGSPHRPHEAAQRFKDMYPEDAKFRDWMGEITGIDYAVGKLRDALRDMGVDKNTLVWYTSDNGGLKYKSTGGQKAKSSIYEGGLRVPGIIEWPSRIKDARTTDLPAVTSDIYPTLLEIADVSLDDQPPLDGESLVPLIRGKDQVRSSPIGFWKHPAKGVHSPTAKWMPQLMKAQKNGSWTGPVDRLRLDAGEIKGTHPLTAYPGHAAWLDWPWKLHRKQDMSSGRVITTLYNLKKDPMERTNLAPEHTDRVKNMRKELERWQKSVMKSFHGADY